MTDNRDWLDEMLQAPHVADDGFADRVAHAVPAPAPRRSLGIVTLFYGLADLALLAVLADVGARPLLDLLDDVLGALPEAGVLASAVAAGGSGKLMLVLGAAAAAFAAALSGEGLQLKRLRLSSSSSMPRLAGGGALFDEQQTASAAAVPTVNLAARKPQKLLEETAELDEETAMEVVRMARKQRPLFATVWFFFLAAPFLVMFLENTGIDVGGATQLVLEVLLAMIVGAFLLGTPIVWFTSRQAFFRDCEQLGISKKLARRLRFRLSVANVLYSPVDERDTRAAARLRQLPSPKRAKQKKM